MREARINQEQVALLYEYLNQLAGVQQTYVEGNTYHFQSSLSDQIALTFHPDGYLQITGDQFFLYHEVACFLSELNLPLFEDVMTKHSKFSVADPSEQARRELAAILKRSRHFLGETLLKILFPSLVYLRSSWQLDDYSSFVFPVMRALEGYIKLLFRSKGIIITRKGFGSVMQHGKVKEFVRKKIDCEATCQAIDRLYQYYSANRHGLFHVDYLIEASKLIETKQEAQRIIMETLHLIEETYCTLPIPLVYKAGEKMSTTVGCFDTKKIGNLRLVLSVSYLNPLEALTEIEQELADEYRGKVVFDLLLCNGSASNRYMEAIFDGAQFDQSSFRVVPQVDEEIRLFSANYYKDKQNFLQSPLISNAFKFLLKKGKVM